MRRILVALGLVIVVVGVVWWLRGRGGDGATHGAAKTEAAQHGKHVQGPREPAKPARVSGRVTRKSDGSGVPGAVVSLAWADLGADLASTKMPTIVVTSDATGAWTADVPPGEYVIAATATGLLPSSRAKLTLASAEQRGGIDFSLDAGGTLVRGTVSDVGGGPIESARVTARRETFSLAPDAELVTLTGADGTYQLSLPDASYRLIAAHDDYTSATHPAEVAGTPLTVDFTLIPGGIVRGQVVARDSGKPLPGALVTVEGARRMRGVGGSRSAISDADGQFVLRGLTSGSMSIEARGRGYASAQPTVVQLGIGEEVDGIQVLVDGAYSIRGRVVEKGTKKGIAGARLGAFSMGAGARGESLEPSAEDGAFEIPGLRPGSYMLYAGAEGTLLEIGQNVEIVDHDVEDVIVEVGRGVTITGRVEPPAVATVTLELEAEVGLGNMFDMVKAAMCRTESDATGAFTLVNAPPGKFRIVGAAKDGRTGKTPITIADADLPGIVVQLTPRASIAGRVIDTNGKPVADINVTANRRDDRPMKFSMSGMRDNEKTRTDGTFEIVGLDAGTYEVHARLPGDFGFELARKDKDGKDDKDDKDKDKSRATIELAEGAKRIGVTLTVEALDGVIRGQVMGPDHKPAADAWVTARREEKLPEGVPANMVSRFGWLSDSEPALTNADGQFVIRKLRKGTYTLVADGPRGASHGEKTGVETGDSATVQLASLGTIALAVTQGGKPVPQYDVTCDGPSGEVTRRAVAQDGTYKLDHLAPGDYACRVRADAGTAEGKVSVPAGEAKLALVIEPWGSLTGTVVSVLTGKPVPELTVVVNSDDNAGGFVDAITGRAPKTDAAGRFVLERVAAGKGRVMFVSPTNSMANLESREYTARAGERVDLGTIKIVPPRNGDAGTFGMATEPDGDALKVTSVSDGGPAAGAGVQVGDRITALAGQPVKTLTPEIAQKLIASGAIGVGQTVTLTLERGAEVTLTSVKW